MEFLKAIFISLFLGTAQGLTEFLPVSSSGHLVLLERIFGFSFEGGGMTFLNLMLHFGTLFAVLIALRREVFSLFRRPFKRLFMLIAATIPAAVVGLLFAGPIDALYAGERGIFFLALSFGGTAVLIFAAELTADLSRRRERTPRFGWKQAMPMGLMQAVAVLPGISRSGSTIAAGVFCGADPAEASRFSFLMSVPVILGGVAVELAGAIGGPASSIAAPVLVSLPFGVLAAALSGYISVRFMLRLVRADYHKFSVYLILLAIACLLLEIFGVL